MKNNCLILLLIARFLLSTQAALCQQVSEKDISAFARSPRYTSIVAFYEAGGGQVTWFGPDSLHEPLTTLLESAASYALFADDYRATSSPAVGGSALVNKDIRLTDAALHFFGDLKAGNRTPTLSYAGLSYEPETQLDASEIQLLRSGRLQELERSFRPRTDAYGTLLGLLLHFQLVQRTPGFREARVRFPFTATQHSEFMLRLYQLGLLRRADTILTDIQMQQTIVRTQMHFALSTNGKVTQALVTALNVPLQQRSAELCASINLLRWLEGLRRKGALLALNIASADMVVVAGDDTLLYSRIVAGKPATPTPTLTSTITEVILFPFWMVPHKIATRELLPLIKASRATLDVGNFQVLDRAGRVVDPRRINWKSLNAGNFPYVLRQMSGCDNALGIVKFNFNNPFTVYLHDTPSKGLFSTDHRFYSHGCMRVEKPDALAHLLLGTNRMAIDTVTAKGCLHQAGPKTIRAERPLPLVVFYATAWSTPKGEPRFFQDVYQRNALLRRQP
ncbi:MAG: hypothetical protein EOO08_05850 [Chitinophagaceae bacterium]|nr:MAG: hypothetical protein EOO08_05850 [Chitinophagaceae bacterium]